MEKKLHFVTSNFISN